MTKSIDDGVELTRRQTLFWLDEQLFPAVPYHHHALTIRLDGSLDRARFRAAFEETQRAIDQFRLVVHVVDGAPRQSIDESIVVALEDVDLRTNPGSFDAFLAERTLMPFDPEKGFHRAALVQLAEASHVFCVFVHHFASDGASVALIVNELRARYAGDPVAYHPPLLRYAEAERAYRSTAKAARDAAYWQAKLAGGVPELRFYGRARGDRSILSTRTWVDAGAEREARLLRRASEEPVHLLNDAVSRLVAIASVVFAFAHRTTGNRRLAIGTPVPNRTAAHLDTCGLLMEQVFITVDVAEEETFRTLVEKVRSDLFQSFRHAQHCVSDRDLDYVTLNLLTHRFEPFEGLETRVRLQNACTMPEVDVATSGDRRNTLGLQIHDFEGGDAFRIGFDFHRATFDRAMRERVPQHFFRVLDAFCDDLDRRLDSIALLGPDEEAELLALGRGPRADGPAPDLMSAIRRNFEEISSSIAAVSPEGEFTYGELGARVAQLAHELVTLGVGAGSRVGLYLERGIDEITTMLATLEVGAAYVPLDPSHPTDRVELVLVDAAPDVLVTHARLRASLNLPPDTRVLVLDESRGRIAQHDRTPRSRATSPTDLAYILFTSGSTGRPKGVEISRGAFSNFLRSMAHTPGLRPTDRLLAITTITFDIAGLELFLPLVVGASVRIADREASIDPMRLRAILESEPITTIQATPATFRLLVEAGFAGDSALRVFVGGEALSSALAAALLERSAELWNLYGPTETTVWSTVERIVDPTRIRIGRAIDRTQLAVVDAAMNLVPRGVIGELAIGGDGVAAGYRGRPDLTSERFVESAHAARGTRLYRTGDLVRFDEDGKLECFGRLDHQVKIRGFRIELGEIEAVLRGVAEVRDVVVVARHDRGPDPRLVAYVVGSADVRDASLREASRAGLPTYMHPAHYVRLDAFPLNTNGKVDRNALPPPGDGHVADRGERRRATNDRETRMIAIFRDVLGVLDVGLDDEFFALGGSSPLALELRRRVASTFDLELPLRVFFESPTPARLLEALAEGGASEPDADAALVVVLRRGPPECPPVFCLLGVQLYDAFARSLSAPRTVYGIHVPVRFSPATDEPPRTTEIAARYVKEIRALSPHGPYLLFGLCFGGLVAFEVAALLRAAGDEVELVGVVDAVLPGAIEVDRFERLRSIAGRAVTESHRIPAYLRRRAEHVVNRLPPSKLRASMFRVLGSDAVLATDEVVDLPLVGPLVRAQFSRFERDAPFLDAKVLVVRAGDEQFARGHRVAEDGGFVGRSRLLTVHTLPGDHLGLLRSPHVERIAQVFEDAIPSK